MSHEVVQEVLNRALSDPAFRGLLLLSPQEALAGFELSDDERAALHTVRLEESAEISEELETRRSKQAPSWWLW